MTSTLPVMDLVVNGPLKAAIRHARVDSLGSFFQDWKCEVLAALSKPIGQQDRPKYSPPKATLSEGLCAMHSACSDLFKRLEFQAGLRRTFVKVGIAPDEEGRYVAYTGQERGTLAAALAPADSPKDHEFFIMDALIELEIESGPEGSRNDEENEEEACADEMLSPSGEGRMA
jgi:hypothetical protein